MFGETKPPEEAHTFAASVEARKVSSACAPLVSFSATPTSPPLTTGALPEPTAGKGKTLASSPTFALVLSPMNAPTKSPS